MKRIQKILLGLILVLIVMQFIQPVRNASNKVPATDITKVYAVPDSVQSLLKTSCYDCHSNNTRYPWYSKIQPGAWFMANHIKNGKADLNFSEFGAYSLRKQRNKLKSIARQIQEGGMPIASYKLMHPNAKLTENGRALLIDWATKLKDSLSVSK